MNEFNYTVIKDSFNRAATIKERKRILNDVLSMKITPYGFKLSKELLAASRPADILHKYRSNIENQRNTLLQRIRKAELTSEEAKLAFNNTTISLGYVEVSAAIKLCNTTPDLICTAKVSPTNRTTRMVDSLSYIVRGKIELAMVRDKIPGYATNNLYLQLTKDLPSYKEVAAPIEVFLKDLEVLQ